MRKIVLKSGDKFNFLTIVEETEKNPKSCQVQYLCLCDCGNETVQTSFNIRHRRVVSCGCYGKVQLGLRTKTHGLTKTRTYRIWAGMNNRCNNPNNQAYDKGLYSTNSSGRTGVSYDKESGKWFAAISKEGVVYRKRFLTFEEACEYREMLEIEHYGFAKK